jgi:hypothetical protein
METTNTETTPVVETAIQPVVRLTKKGKPDKRSVTSRENINKAQSKVKEIVAKAKKKYDAVVIDEGDSEEDESDSDTEYAIRKVRSQVVTDPIPIPAPTIPQPAVDTGDILQRIELLTKSLDQLKGENQTLRNSFHQSNNLNRINSMTRQMMMKF